MYFRQGDRPDEVVVFVKTDTLFPPVYILLLIEMTVDVDRWHVASIYG